MNGRRITLNIAMVAGMMLALGFAGRTASAGVRWVLQEVRVPYTYYTYETETRYRTVTRRVVRTEYRTERRREIEYITERRLVEEPYIGIHGRRRIRQVWKTVRIPQEVWKTVRVPVEVVSYETVREPYTVQVRVAHTGYRVEHHRVAVQVGSPKFSVTLGTVLGGSKSSHRRPSRRRRDARDSSTSIRFTWSR
jgi:hypothetical protein